MMRLLSAKSVRHAQIVSIAGGIVSLLMAVPPVLLGVVGVSTSNAEFLDTDTSFLRAIFCWLQLAQL